MDPIFTISNLVSFFFGAIFGATIVLSLKKVIKGYHVVGVLLMLQMFAWTSFHLLGQVEAPKISVFALGALGAMLFIPIVNLKPLSDFFNSVFKK